MKYSSYSPSLRVLIADDDVDDRQMLSDAIEGVKVDVEVHIVESGASLMEYLAHCNGNTPDLIFLDLNMPKKNGLECLNEIRTDVKFKGMMIAMYSSSSAVDEMENAFHAGANIFITKPNSQLALDKIIKDVLSVYWQYHTSHLNKENFVMVR